MDNFETTMAELLEVDNVVLSDELASFEAWDSLTVLSVIAFCDEEYQVVLSADEINNAQTLNGLMDLILKKKSN